MKTKSTIATFLTRAAMVLLLTVMTTPTWAQSVGENIYSGFTATAGTQSDEEVGYACLVDGRYTEDDCTKWLCRVWDMEEGDSVWYVDFHADQPISITKYILTTADDAEQHWDFNPTSWIIKAKLLQTDRWTTIATVNDDNTLEAENCKDYEFLLDTLGTYQFFRFMVPFMQKDKLKDKLKEMQLAELRFKNDITDLIFARVDGLQKNYSYTGSAINLSYLVKDAVGNQLEEGVHYTAVITNSSGTTVSEVKNPGSYTLTLTAVDNSGYTGEKSIQFEVVPWTGEGGFCGNPEVNSGKNLYYELSESEEGKILTIFVHPDVIGDDFSIANNAFSLKKDIKQVIISNGVTSIGNRAFYSCSSLTTITIPNSVTSIGKDAFLGTAWWNQQEDGVVYLNHIAVAYKGEMSESTTITLKDGTTGFGIGAFQWCKNLIGVIIPNSVTSIAESVFNGCSGLTSLTIGNSVTSIAESAFNGCSGLTSVTIPNSVTSIGQSAFERCSGLTSVTIPNSVTSIGQSAFERCSGLTSVTIGNSVTNIGQSAFYACSSLTSLTIGNSVTSIGESAFEGCSGLTSLTIPNSVTNIDRFAFYACSGLTSVTIGSGVDSIGHSAFNKCRNLSDMYCYANPSGMTWIGAHFDFKENKATLCHVFDAGAWGDFGDVNVTFVGDLTIRFEDLADNRDFITAFNNQQRSVTLLDRTIYKNGEWTTLCLPFHLSSLTGTPLEGFTIKELDTENAYDGHKTGVENGTLYLNFKDATSIVAGKPYIVKKLVTDVDEESTPTYEATDGTAGSLPQQGYANLIDGNPDGYRWRTNFDSNNPSFCEFHSDAPVYVTGDTLTTGNQGVINDPTVWTLSVSADGNAPWTVIDSRNTIKNTADALPSGRTTKKAYTVQKPGIYQYFRFEVKSTVGNTYMCLSELTLQAKHVIDAKITDPVFTNVTISSEPTAVTSSDGAVSFIGSYKPTDLIANDRDKLYLGAFSTLGYPTSNMTISSSRAWFQLNNGLMASLKGDVNGDGKISVTDVMGLVNSLLGHASDNFVIDEADTNGDGQISVTDVMVLVKSVIQGNKGISNVVINTGDDPITFGGGSTGPARVKKRQ